MKLAKRISYHVYVNSRPLVRLYEQGRKEVNNLQIEYIPAYFAGRFDGDGCVNKGLRSDLRISYGRELEAYTDQKILLRIDDLQTRVYRYRTSNTYVLYVYKGSAQKFLSAIFPYSIKLQSLIAP